MTESQAAVSQARLSANLVAFILTLNFMVIGGLIALEIGLPTPQPVEGQAVALAETPPLPAGDAANGAVLFTTFQAAAGFACSTCHYVDREDRLIGPGLLNVGTRAAARVAGQAAYDYLRTAIVEPGAFVVPDYPDGLMPRNWAQVYSAEQIDDLIAYLLTLQP